MPNIIYENKRKGCYITEEKAENNRVLQYYKDGDIHSAFYPDNPFRMGFFLTSSLLSLLNNAKKILILGMGIGCSLVQLKELLPECHIKAVDIDPDVFILSQNFIGIGRYKDIQFIHDNALHYVLKTSEKFDYILVDVFNKGQIPPGFISLEFFHNIFSLLNENGIMVLNTHMRNMRFFEKFSNANPLSYVHQMVYAANFQTVFQNDFHNSGWMFAFKAKTTLSSIKKNLYTRFINEKNIYLKMNIGVNILYIEEVNNNFNLNRLSSVKEHDDLAKDYKWYILRNMMRISKMKLSQTPQESLKDILCISTFQTLLKKIDHLQEYESMQSNFFETKDEHYFNRLSEYIGKSKDVRMSNVLPYIILPSDIEVLVENNRGFLMNLLRILSAYLTKDLVLEEAVIDTYVKREIG